MVRVRPQRGGTIAEFGCAFAFMLCIVLIPIMEITAYPVRCVIAQSVIQSFIHDLAMAEKRSDSARMLTAKSWHRDFAAACGINFKRTRLRVHCFRADGQELVVEDSTPIPDTWLSPSCVYQLELQVETKIEPVSPGGNVAGLMTPESTPFSSFATWQNIGRDATSRKYFINE
jgi:hypothetical protein